MAKQPAPHEPTMPFSLSRQFTAPPFSAALVNAELRSKMLFAAATQHEDEPGQPAAKKPGKKAKAAPAKKKAPARKRAK